MKTSLILVVIIVCLTSACSEEGKELLDRQISCEILESKVHSVSITHGGAETFVFNMESQPNTVSKLIRWVNQNVPVHAKESGAVDYGRTFPIYEISFCFENSITINIPLNGLTDTAINEFEPVWKRTEGNPNE